MTGCESVAECARCGRSLATGGTHYLVSITLVADYNGTIPESHREGGVDYLLQEIESKSQDELENEIYQQLSFVLCKGCRDEYVTNPMGRSGKELPEVRSPH